MEKSTDSTHNVNSAIPYESPGNAPPPVTKLPCGLKMIILVGLLLTVLFVIFSPQGRDGLAMLFMLLCGLFLLT